MTRIEVLDAAQRERLAAYCERWRRLQLSTDRVDRSSAERGVRAAYRAASLDPPKRIVWCDGPGDMVRDWRLTRLMSQVGHNVRKTLVDAPRLKANVAIHDHLGHGARSQVFGLPSISETDRISAAVIGAVREGTRRAGPGLLGTVKQLITDLARLKVSGLAPATLASSGLSQHEFGWLAAYRFLHNELGLRSQTENLDGLWRLGANAGWVIPQERVCWLCERHSVLNYDDRGRLHCCDGPAVQYPDGWAAYAWKGIAIPASFVEDRNGITIAKINKQPDRILRRCMIEIMTPERFVAAGGARRVAKDGTGILWHKVWFDGDTWAAVEVVNGTAHADGTRTQYFLQVPGQLYTPRAAVAWTYGLSEQSYTYLTRRT